MQEFIKIYLIFIVAIIFWTVFLLLQDKRSNPYLNRWFAAFLVALSTPHMEMYASLASPPGIYLFWLLASSFLWLKGPFLWVFIGVLIRRPRNYLVTSFHFIPCLAATFVLSQYPQFGLALFYVALLQLSAYLLLSGVVLYRNRLAIAAVWQGFQNSAYYWLIYIIVGLMLLVVVDLAVITSVQLGLLADYKLLDFCAFPIFSLYVLSIAILSVYRPELIFRGQQDTVLEELSQAPAVVEALEAEKSALQLSIVQEVPQNNKERYLALDISLAQILIQQLTRLMEEEKVYRQNELSLPELAAMLGISVHQLSELLNVHKGVTFYEYVNGYRLQYVCQLLKDPDCQLRMLDIAFEAGFNNKNSFYRVFKENLGVTPNSYRSSLVSQPPAKSAAF